MPLDGAIIFGELVGKRRFCDRLPASISATTMCKPN